MRQISKKAYEGFNKQLNNAFKVVPNCYCNGVGIVLSMIDLYLAEKDVRLQQRTMEVKLAYTMLLPELEKAVARSARARENAARRRERKLAEQNAKKSEANVMASQEITEIPEREHNSETFKNISTAPASAPNTKNEESLDNGNKPDENPIPNNHITTPKYNVGRRDKEFASQRDTIDNKTGW